MFKYILNAVLILTFFFTIPLTGAAITADSTVQKDTANSSKIITDSTSLPADTTIADTSDIIHLEKKEEVDTVMTTIPAGTILVINLYKPVSTTQSAGSSFSQILDDDFSYSDKVIAPAGSIVKGKIVESRRGSKITFNFSEISVNCKTIAVKTETAGIEGSKDKTARIVGQVFFSGGPFGGGTAGNGAPITGGLEGFSSGQKDIMIPAGTIIKVPLREDLVIKE